MTGRCNGCGEDVLSDSSPWLDVAADIGIPIQNDAHGAALTLRHRGIHEKKQAGLRVDIVAAA